MSKNVQIVKVSESLLNYFKMMVDFDNQGDQYRNVTEKEFKQELEKALNNGIGNKEVVWVKQ